MTDDWGRERVEPVAIGPPRRRMNRVDRIRAERRHRRRRVASGITIALLIVVVVGAVFVGSKLWHTLFGTVSDFSGDGVNDVVIQVHEGDSTTAIGQTLEDHGRSWRRSARLSTQRTGNAASLVDPARFLQVAHRNTGRQCR